MSLGSSSSNAFYIPIYISSNVFLSHLNLRFSSQSGAKFQDLLEQTLATWAL